MAEGGHPRPGRIRAAVLTAGGARGWILNAGLIGAVPAIWQRWWARCLEQEMAERRLDLWLPVAFGAGVLLYFLADAEPSIWAPAVALVLALVGVYATRRRFFPLLFFIACAVLFGGFLSGCLRTALVAAPLIERFMIADVTGFIEVLDPRIEGARFVVRVTQVEELTPAATPYRLRLTARQRPVVKAGDHVRFKARLVPSPGPARPDGYDFSRDAFFKGIGGVGSVLGGLTLTEAAPRPPLGLAILAAIDRARNTLTERIALSIGGQAGALAAALVTGKRDLIDEASNDALRAAGVYHIVSISGLHMVLAAGAFFWTARALLALFPAIALAWPVKKLAALLAMFGATAYCVFTGSEVATERSLLMILIMLGAVLVDRPALTMRNLAISALLILAREPESLLGPSFQMSFAAVAGLVALAEWQRGRERDDFERPSGFLGRFSASAWFWLAGLVLTTVVATLATAPFSAFHFQRLNPFGLIGNSLALPFVSFIVMPAAVAGVLLYPFGLDSFIWWLMGQGTQPVLSVSRTIQAWSGSVTSVPAFGSAGLLLMALGLLWFTLWRSQLRWFALAPALLGVALAAHPARPDMFVDRQGQGAALRMPDGRLAVLGDPSPYVIGFWLQADGDARSPRDKSLKERSFCDKAGCTLSGTAFGTVAFVKERYAFPEDCARADVIITRLEPPAFCTPKLLIGRTMLERQGAMTLTQAASLTMSRGTRDPARLRPWQVPSREARAPPEPVVTPAVPRQAPAVPASSEGEPPETIGQ